MAANIFIDKVHAVIEKRLDALPLTEAKDVEQAVFRPGKMLRSRFAASLGADSSDSKAIATCAAIEFVHSATLFHDDIIDGAEVRRAMPSLWRQSSPAAAVLAGDLFFCEAINLMITEDADYLFKPFMEKVKEVCEAEVEQEMILRGRMLKRKECMSLSRRKTGALFAMVAMACSDRKDKKLNNALEEAGYLFGTAYQLTDDLKDKTGCEKSEGKTLGTDLKRKKCTLIQIPGVTETDVIDEIDSLCQKAIAQLSAWPERQKTFADYVSEVFSPISSSVK